MSVTGCGAKDIHLATLEVAFFAAPKRRSRMRRDGYQRDAFVNDVPIETKRALLHTLPPFLRDDARADEDIVL
jgi:hypothetical protein